MILLIVQTNDIYQSPARSILSHGSSPVDEGVDRVYRQMSIVAGLSVYVEQCWCMPSPERWRFCVFDTAADLGVVDAITFMVLSCLTRRPRIVTLR